VPRVQPIVTSLSWSVREHLTGLQKWSSSLCSFIQLPVPPRSDRIPLYPTAERTVSSDWGWTKVCWHYSHFYRREYWWRSEAKLRRLISARRSLRLKVSVDVDRLRRNLETLSRLRPSSPASVSTHSVGLNIFHVTPVLLSPAARYEPKFHHCSTRLTRESSFHVNKSSASPFKNCVFTTQVKVKFTL
jgi:hypothetical protein